jgi:hypothetical protein
MLAGDESGIGRADDTGLDALHLAEGVILSGVVGLAVVQRFVEPREQTLRRAAFAFLDAIDEPACAALDDLDRTPHTQYEEGEPDEAEE